VFFYHCGESPQSPVICPMCDSDPDSFIRRSRFLSVIPSIPSPYPYTYTPPLTHLLPPSSAFFQHPLIFVRFYTFAFATPFVSSFVLFLWLDQGFQKLQAMSSSNSTMGLGSAEVYNALVTGLERGQLYKASRNSR